MALPSATIPRVLLRFTSNNGTDAHFKQTFTLIRLPFLQYCRHGSSCGHRSLMRERPSLPRRVRRRGASWLWDLVEQGSSHTSEKVAVHGSSRFFKGLRNDGRSCREEVRRPVIRCVNASNDPETTTQFFFDELMEAELTMEKLSEPVDSEDSIQPWRTEEKATSQLGECAYGENTLETNRESGHSHWDVLQGLERSGPERLPIDSNGPPMVILQPYLVWDNCQKEVNDPKLRQLPCPEPHKARLPGIPRPSLRRRLGVGYSRKSIPAVQVYSGLVFAQQNFRSRQKKIRYTVCAYCRPEVHGFSYCGCFSFSWAVQDRPDTALTDDKEIISREAYGVQFIPAAVDALWRIKRF